MSQRIWNTSQVLLAAALLAASPTKLFGQRDFGSGEAQTQVSWHDDEHQERLQGLKVIRIGPQSYVSRLLAETPDGSRIILTQKIDPQTGIMQNLLADDTSRWWARFTLETGFSAPTLGGFFDAVNQEVPVPAEKENRVGLSTSDGFEFETPLKAALQPRESYRTLVERLSAADLAARLSDSIPPSLRDAILFLDASLSPEPHLETDPEVRSVSVFRGPADVLAGVLRLAPPEGLSLPARAWRLEVGPIRKGLVPDEPETLELVAGFRSVSADRLLPEVEQPESEP